MFSILIAEDEPWTRKGIISKIEHCELEITPILEAQDGQQAFEIIEARKPDIVITDIRMPALDGLQLIDRARQKALLSMFIIISGYSDFDYAKQALEMDVRSYIMKPVKMDDLRAALLKAIDAIRKKNENLVEHSFYQMVFKGSADDPAVSLTEPAADKKSLLNGIVRYMKEHVREDFTREQISKTFNITPNYFSRIFSEEFHISFSRYASSMRVNKAKELLVTTDLSISEIAGLVGFNDVQYFWRVFKKEQGKRRSNTV